jgi:hypothetical protein
MEIVQECFGVLYSLFMKSLPGDIKYRKADCHAVQGHIMAAVSFGYTAPAIIPCRQPLRRPIIGSRTELFQALHHQGNQQQ